MGRVEQGLVGVEGSSWPTSRFRRMAAYEKESHPAAADVSSRQGEACELLVLTSRDGLKMAAVIR